MGVSLQANSVYTLTVGVGNRNTGFTPTDGSQASTFGLYAGGDAGDGGTLLAESTVDAGPLGESSFADFSLVYETTDALEAGDLFVSLRTTGGGRAHYDNVRLEVIPEPTSLTLIGIAGLGLMSLRRRRTKQQLFQRRIALEIVGYNEDQVGGSAPTRSSFFWRLGRPYRM